MVKKPNILIILAEDICPNLGCYGDENARTPNLDRFAEENVMFRHCYSAAPVCSAARTSLNLGINGPSAGVGNHRSLYQLPNHIKNFGDYMQGEGYYTMIGKTDLNFQLKSGYDELISYTRDDTPDFAINLMNHIQKVKEQPVFVLQTMAITHQSQYGYTEDREEHRTTMPRLREDEYQERDTMKIPEYHFKSMESDEVWAQYHEKMTSMDRMFGELVEELKNSGTYEDTVLIFAGDNGHGIPSGKSTLWNEGVHVPMLAHFPKYLEEQLDLYEDVSGKVCDRLVSFVDYLATALSIAGGDIPEYLEGRPLVGLHKVENPKEVYSFGMRVDEGFENSRCIHEETLMYTCDFGLTPYRRLNAYQTIQSPWFVRSMIEEGYNYNISDVDRRALFRQIPRVKEQLFDLKKDKASLENLAVSQYKDVKRLREKMYEYIVKTHDAVWMPEALIMEIMEDTGMIPYEILHDKNYYPLERLVQLWDAGLNGNVMHMETENACEKIWITKIMNDNGEKFDKYLYDESEVVSAYAAYRVGDSERLAQISQKTNNYVLLMFIIDMISNTRDKHFENSFQIIANRNLDKEKFGVDERFVSAMNVGIDMLSLRLSSSIPEDMLQREFWCTDKHRKVCMVLDELDLH